MNDLALYYVFCFALFKPDFIYKQQGKKIKIQYIQVQMMISGR